MPPWQNTATVTRVCATCSKSFEAKRATARYCSDRCREQVRPQREPASAEQRAEWRRLRLEQPGYRERVNAVGNARATAIRRWLDAYKLEQGCVDCGFRTHPAALHFDHIQTDKAMNVCNAKSIGAAQREITKCVVRCANCHAIKTWPHLLVRTSS